MEISLEKYEAMQDRIAELEMAIEIKSKQLNYAIDLVVARDDEIFRLRAKHPHWISVKDRLPEDSGQVLAYGAGEIFMAYFDADFHDGAWFKYFLNDDCQDPYLDPYYGEIRCWMPLPEPPEEAKDEM